MSDPCPACVEAQSNPYSGLTYVSCEQCNVRAVSRWPLARRQDFYDSIADELSRRTFVHLVKVEHERTQALRARLAAQETPRDDDKA